jgi:hypothetical protein
MNANKSRELADQPNNSSYTSRDANTANNWGSSNYQLSSMQNPNNIQSSIPTNAHAFASSNQPLIQNSDFVEPNFNTEDANLLEFFRYGLAEWPDSTNIWPPINDFGPGAG